MHTASAKRILHLTSVHPRYDTRILLKQCVSLANSGYDVHLLVADGIGDETLQQVHIHDVGKAKNRFIRIVITPIKIFCLALRLKADLFHFHDPDLLPYGLLLKLTGKPVIYDIHEHYRDTFTEIYYLPRWMRQVISRSYGALEYLAGRVLNSCVVATQHMQDTLPLKKCVAVENHVKLSEFTPDYTSDRQKAVCYVGVLHHARCIPEIVDASYQSGAILYLAGKYYGDNLQQTLQQKAGWANVRELGTIDRRQMQDLFNRCMAGLLILVSTPNHDFSSSNKLFEYMAAGLPVIATDLPSIRAVIEKHQCGLLVDANNTPQAIAQAITWVLSNPQEAQEMGKRGREAVEALYAWSYQEKKLLALYDELLQKPAHAS